MRYFAQVVTENSDYKSTNTSVVEVQNVESALNLTALVVRMMDGINVDILDIGIKFKPDDELIYAVIKIPNHLPSIIDAITEVSGFMAMLALL